MEKATNGFFPRTSGGRTAATLSSRDNDFGLLASTTMKE